MEITILYGILIIYLSGVFIPIIFGSVKSINIFLFANKKLTWYEMTLGQIGSRYDFYLILIIPGIVAFEGGLYNLLDELLIFLGMILTSLFLSKVIAVKAFIYDIFNEFFRHNIKLIISTLLGILKFIIVLILLKELTLFITDIVKIPTHVFLFFHVSLATLLIYFGGIRPGVYFNMFFLTVLLGLIVVNILFGIFNLGGWDGFIKMVNFDELFFVHPDSLTFKRENLAFYTSIINKPLLIALTFGLDYSYQIILSGGKDEKTIKWALFGNSLSVIFFSALLGIMGLIVKYNILRDDPNYFNSHQVSYHLLPDFWSFAYHPLIYGLFLGVVCIASISSLWNILLSLLGLIYFNFNEDPSLFISRRKVVQIDLVSIRIFLIILSTVILFVCANAMDLNIKFVDLYSGEGLDVLNELFLVFPFISFFVSLLFRNHFFERYFPFVLFFITVTSIFLINQHSFLLNISISILLVSLFGLIAKFLKADVVAEQRLNIFEKSRSPISGIELPDYFMFALFLLQLYLSVQRYNIMNI